LSVTFSLTLPIPSPRAVKQAIAEAPTDRRVSLGELLIMAVKQAVKADNRVHLTLRENLITGLLGSIMVFGLFIDGWAHINLRDDRLGPFFTPWHAILYTGFTFVSIYILRRNQTGHTVELKRVPAGYGLAIVGMGLSMIALAGDAVWHTVFGAEVGLTRLMAPFHLFLFTGSCLLVTSPLRAGWQSDMPAVVTKFRKFFPTVLSLALVTTMISFFVQYASPLVYWKQIELTGRLVAGSRLFETLYIHEALSVVITNLIFIAPVLFVLKRWRPPMGTFTFLFTFVALFDAELTQFSRLAVVAAFGAGGLVADMLIRELRPTPERRAAIRAIGALTPAVLWGGQFLIASAVYGINWPLEIWMGATVLACMSGFMLALLMFPAPIPAGAWGERRAVVAEEDSDVSGAAARPLRARTVAATRVRRDMAQPSRARTPHRTTGRATLDTAHRRNH
jgi:hypothetical protein